MLATVFTKTTRDRWRGMAIGSGALAAMLLLAMPLYQQFDLSVYSDLPEAVRSLFNFPEGSDLAGIAYGAVYGTYGALTLAGIAIAMGASAIAGEERDGTIGLLLANPKSRTHVLVSEAGSLALVAVLGTAVAWAGARIAPALYDVAVGGFHIEALMFHMLVNAIFYGLLALAVGAWTGSTAAASGTAGGVMVVSLFGAGLFPLIGGWENVAKVFPWYYYDGAAPVNNGVAWGHIAVLLAGGALCAIAAVVGVNRRDLRDRSIGVSLVDRLRANPMTKQLADRLAGSARVSRIWIKTATEHQGLTMVVAGLMFGLMGVAIGPMFNLIDTSLLDFSGLPDALKTLLGGGTGDMSTPVGWYRGETFGLMAPIAVMTVGIAVGARALAGEEARRTMGLLLSNPVSRASVLREKTAAMVLLVVTVGFATFAGVTVGSLLGNLGLDVGNIAAVCVLVTLLGLVFGGLALALGAATGRARFATFGTVGIALFLYLAQTLLPLNDSLAGLAQLTPFYYYLESDPLANGLDWGHAAVLTVTAASLIASSVWLFQRRDLRQTG
jgi:ABC-2 type transport system permease protein